MKKNQENFYIANNEIFCFGSMLPMLWKKRRMWHYMTIYSSIHGYFLLVVKSGRIPCVKLRRVNRKKLWGLSLLCKFPKRRVMGKFSLRPIFRNNKFHWNCARSNNDIYPFYVLVLCLCRCTHRYIPSHPSHVQVFTKFQISAFGPGPFINSL